MPAYIGVNGKAKGIRKVYQGNSEGKAEQIWGPKSLVRLAKNDIAKIPLDENCVGLGSCYGTDAGYDNTNCIFAGGGDGRTSEDTAIIRYDENLIQTQCGSLLCGGPNLSVAKNPKDYQYEYFFAPGYIAEYSPSGYTNRGKKITAVTSEGTVSEFGSLKKYRYDMGAVGFWAELAYGDGQAVEGQSSSGGIATAAAETPSEETYVIFAGGYNETLETGFKDVELFMSNGQGGTSTSIQDLTLAVEHPGATAIGGYVLIGGGIPADPDNDTPDVCNIMNAYNSSLSKVTVDNLFDCDVIHGDDGTHYGCTGKSYPDATATEKYAIFGPSYNQMGEYFNHYIDLYDRNLVHTYLDPCNMSDSLHIMSDTRYKPKVCVLNEYITVTYKNYNVDQKCDELRMLIYDPDLIRLDDVVISCNEDSYYTGDVKGATVSDKYILIPAISSNLYYSSSAYYLWE